jgi:exodeoxyribonuclease VII large subunit
MNSDKTWTIRFTKTLFIDNSKVCSEWGFPVMIEIEPSSGYNPVSLQYTLEASNADMDLPGRKVLTVSALTEQIRSTLESKFQSVWVRGEISNYRPAPSGHLYFTLKDETSQIRCVMFKIQSRFLKFRLHDGLQVIVWGKVSVYGARGEYQLILDTMEPAGLGGLMLAFEQLRERLTAEGLFDPSKKRNLPAFPKTIGLVTSSKGAAVSDMIRILRRRFPAVHILVSPSSVQGDRAPAEIKAAINRLCQASGVDVIIVGRGGGATEDLWAFNDERVVRAVATCPIPIVSAVGHETDVTLSDFAADVRASTPSAAAEIVLPDRRDLRENLAHIVARLTHSMRNAIRRNTGAVEEQLKRLFNPRRQIQEKRLALDDMIVRMTRAVKRRIDRSARETELFTQRLKPGRLFRQIETGREQCKSLMTRLHREISGCASDRRTALLNLTARLDALSPLSVLSRGYSIALKPKTSEVIKDSSAVEIGDTIEIRLHRGGLLCRVSDKTGDANGRIPRRTSDFAEK